MTDERVEAVAGEGPAVDVFEFADPREFLCAVLEEKKKRSAAFSMRAWSRQLGFRTPSYLSAVLRGTRRLQPNFATKLSKNLKLSDPAATRLELLALRENCKDSSQADLYDRMLKSLSPVRFRTRLDLDRFKLISDWYHLVLLEMVELPDFRPDPEYLARRLGGTVMPSLVASALKRLLRLKLLRKGPSGKIVRGAGQVFAGDGVPNHKIRQHHLQFIEKAKRALLESPLEQRDFRGSTFAFSKENVPKARELIRQVHQALRDLSEEKADSVYRFNTQLFCLTIGDQE
ncbi:MAG: TIGR02147 family protein [Bdellovibrionaceae bacterium]|nr:TIGR02147 family protein [Bdellovibrionales bacterium]MCB9254851.1 TIGR02147 family protein [Pseudobdellovibrionaceae bacterium]